jgi:hypothetical protein
MAIVKLLCTCAVNIKRTHLLLSFRFGENDTEQNESANADDW